MFDLKTDPEETRNLAHGPRYFAARTALRAEMEAMCDTSTANAQALADQASLIARFGRREAAFNLDAPGATPPPQT